MSTSWLPSMWKREPWNAASSASIVVRNPTVRSTLHRSTAQHIAAQHSTAQHSKQGAAQHKSVPSQLHGHLRPSIAQHDSATRQGSACVQDRGTVHAWCAHQALEGAALGLVHLDPVKQACHRIATTSQHPTRTGTKQRMPPRHGGGSVSGERARVESAREGPRQCRSWEWNVCMNTPARRRCP